MNNIQVLDKSFEIAISHERILNEIKNLATILNVDLINKDVIFLGILNGSFMFASDLLKVLNIPCQISFLKVASYNGTSSTGNVKRLIGINEDIKDKTVIIIEDIIDTGNTIESIIKQLKGYEPKEIKIATLLFKPDLYKKDLNIDYICFRVPDKFLVGYGLDYGGYGRNYSNIYQHII